MSDSSQSTRIIIEEGSTTGLKQGLIAAIIITGGITLILLLGLFTPDGGSGIKLLPSSGGEETMISRLRQGLLDDPLLTTLSRSVSSPSQSGLITGREPGTSGLGPDQDDEGGGAKSEFCPGYNSPVPYLPFHHDFKVTIPPRWCITFGYGSTWGPINFSQDWYFYTKRKAGLRPKDIAGQFAQVIPFNDLYFCGPLYLCGTHYEYYDSLDAAGSSNLPDVDISQVGYNGLDPRHSYHVRLLARGNVGSLADFHRWATERAKGAGYYLNRRETNSAALRALKTAPEKNPPAYAPRVTPWQPEGADPRAALVFDLYVPCIPPEYNPAEFDPNEREKAKGRYYLDDGADLWMARYAPETTAQIETARLIDRYFGACLGGIFGRKEVTLISRGFNYKRDSWWEKTGAKAYLVWNKGKVYELRLASPKLVRLECVSQATADYKSEGYGPCGERTVEILDHGSEILRLALGEVTGTTLTGQELEALLDQCLPVRPRPDLLENLEGLVNPEGDKPAQREITGQEQSLIDDCLRIRWWNIQEAYSRAMVDSFTFTGKVTTPAPRPASP